jgi:NADPH2:quinone reductase
VRAVRVHGAGEPAEVLRLEEVDVPEPGAGRLRIRVRAAAANLPDVMLARGTYPLRPESGPFVPGLEAAGVVDAVGGEVDRDVLGARVVGVTELPHGAFAEFAIIPADRVYRIPDGIADVDAVATLIAFQTAHVALHRRGRLAPGETLVVLGAAGGVGSAAVQLGRNAGARVVAVAGGDAKLQRCRELGADVVVDSQGDGIVDRLRDAVGPHGADVVFDPVGGEAHAAAVSVLATDARVLLVGFASGLPRVDPGSVLRASYGVLGVYVGAYSNDDAGREYLRDVQESIFDDLRAGRIRSVVDRTVSLDQVVPALEDLAARRVTGKIIVLP